MRTMIDLGTVIPGFCDAEGEMVEMDEDGRFYAPCSKCGKEIASHCAYDVVFGRMCNECCSGPAEELEEDIDPEVRAMLDRMFK